MLAYIRENRDLSPVFHWLDLNRGSLECFRSGGDARQRLRGDWQNLLSVRPSTRCFYFSNTAAAAGFNASSMELKMTLGIRVFLANARYPASQK